eukprot:46344-Prorocentrum_lima.AAC.1
MAPGPAPTEVGVWWRLQPPQTGPSGESGGHQPCSSWSAGSSGPVSAVGEAGRGPSDRGGGA